MEMIYKTFLQFAFILGLLVTTAVHAEFVEYDIEDEEVMANSEASIEEKNQIQQIQQQEKQQTVQEKKLAQQARWRAEKAENEASKEVERVRKEVEKWRVERKKYELEKQAAEKKEEMERQKINKAKLEEENLRAELAEAKKQYEDAQRNYLMAQQVASISEKKNAKIKKDLAAIQKRISSLNTAKTFNNKAPKRKGASVAESRMPASQYIAQDCNLRLGPSGQAEVFSVLKKGAKVMVQGRKGNWYMVSTPEIQRAYLANNCL